MRVLLVGPDLESNLSLRYLAASLRAAGHEASITSFNGDEDAPAVLREAASADLIGLSMCFQVRALEFLDLAVSLKRQNLTRPIIAGGHYASCASTDLLDHHPELDLIVVHEGEQTIVELANLGEHLLRDAERVPGVVLRRDGRPWSSAPRPSLSELDGLPRPDRSGPARMLCGVPTAYMMGSRGCVNACDYCCITTLHRMVPGQRFRQRTPEDVADEMASLYHQRGVRQFVFHDDNFLVPNFEHNRSRIERISAALDAKGVADFALVLKCSPKEADRRILERLQKLGLIRIFMGIESGSQCGLDSIGRRQTTADSERALAICEGLGISTQYTMIILHPEASPESMLADLSFVERHPGHPLNYCRAEIYAGTPLEQRMISQGRALGDYLARTYTYTDPRVALVWEVGQSLFAGRCWGKDELLGRVIRMDHQVAVLKRFYSGRKAKDVAKSFLEWEVELNLETAGFFRELVVACASAKGAEDPQLESAIADLSRRELSSRDQRIRQACDFRAALDGFAQQAIELGQRQAMGAPAPRRARGPRHAAAIAVALGFMGCRTPTLDHGVAEAAPPPLDRELMVKPAPVDAGTFQVDPGVAEAPPPPMPPRPPANHQNDLGVAEAPPPPLPPRRPDAGVEKKKPTPKDSGIAPSHTEQPYLPDNGVAEAAPPPLDERRIRRDHGVAEAAPPPFDDRRLRRDHGVAEAAPPPLDDALLPAAPRDISVTVTPAARILVNGGKVQGPVKLSRNRNGFLQIGTGSDPVNDPFVVFIDYKWKGNQLSLRVECTPAVEVSVPAQQTMTSPASFVLNFTGRPTIPISLVDPKTKAHMQVFLAEAR